MEVECEEGAATADESGGGRYAMNIITLTIPYTLVIKTSQAPALTGCELKLEREFKVENAAGNYEECC